MKGALIIFAATYISVFTLGLQSLNVNQGHYLAAAITSFFIGTGNILLYKYMPDPSGFQLVGYYAGGIVGITSSIWFHKRFKAWWPGWRALRDRIRRVLIEVARGRELQRLLLQEFERLNRTTVQKPQRSTPPASPTDIH